MRFDSILQDARSAVRTMRHRPLGTASAIAMLGLAIGLTAAMFTIVDALILRPVPFPNADQVAVLHVRTKNGGPLSTRPAGLAAWRETHAFAAVEAAAARTAVVATDLGDVTRHTADVTPGIFNLLGGVKVVRGRIFDDGDGKPGADGRVLVSEELWRTRFNADPAIAGRAISLDGKPVTIIGVLSSDFRFPEWNTEIWRAVTFDANDTSAKSPIVYVRYSAGTPSADALKLATAAAMQAGVAREGMWAAAKPLGADGLDEYYTQAVPFLLAGVVMLFVVLCANTGSVQLASLAARRRDFATRTALGAPRSRLARQALIESGLIGAAGLATGLAAGWMLVSIARVGLPTAALMNSLNPLDLDARAFMVASATALIATLASGLVPAFIGTRVDVVRSLNAASRAGTDTPRARLATRILLVTQIAVSCMLLIGATGLMRSFVNLMTADRGIDSHNVVVAWLAMTSPSLKSPDARDNAVRAIEEDARTIPGVTHAAWSYGTPPLGAIGLGKDWTPEGGSRVSLQATQSIVGADFFALYGIPIVRGRSFAPGDGADAVVISERLANAFWPNGEAVGLSVGLDNEEESPRKLRAFRVVGVAKDTYFPSVRRDADPPQLYTQYRTTAYTPMLSLRCSGPCPDAGVLRLRFMAAAPGIVVQDLNVLDDVYATQFARPRAAGAVALAFAFAALVSASFGLFTLLSHAAARRRREFGIRSALGASPSDVRRLVWRDGLGVTAMGLVIGAVAGIVALRFVGALLYQVPVSDPIAWSIVTGVLALTITAAAWPPARSAAKAAPVTLLREE